MIPRRGPVEAMPRTPLAAWVLSCGTSYAGKNRRDLLAVPNPAVDEGSPALDARIMTRPTERKLHPHRTLPDGHSSEMCPRRDIDAAIDRVDAEVPSSPPISP